MRIDDRARRALLIARHHLGRTGHDALSATRDLLALHSSDPATPHLALWARVDRYQPADLERALEAELCRLHAMRRTLWIAATDEVPTLDASVTRDIAAKEHAKVLKWADRPDADAWIEGLAQQVLGVLETAPGTSTRQLSAEIPALATPILMGTGKWAAEAPIGSRLLFLMAMDLRITRTAPLGSWRASQYGWRVAAPHTPVDPATARARLVQRYLERFGPVTETDIAWWTGLTKARVRGALVACGAVEVELEAGAGWIAPGTTIPPLQANVALLPGLDPTPMGYKERAWFLGPHQDALFDRNGNIGPTIFVDGRIVGGWAVDAAGAVVHRLLEPLPPDRELAVQAEAAALTGWLNGTSVIPRFRTPLERELTA